MQLAHSTTFLLTADKKSGLLSRVVRTFFNRGYTPTGQQAEHNAASGMTQLSVFFDSELTLRAADIEAIKNVDASIRDIRIEYPQAVNLVEKRFGVGRCPSEPEFFDFMTKQFPAIVFPILSYKNRLPEEKHKPTLRSLGLNLGNRDYAITYSRGNPMQLEQALKRIVQPAVNAFVPAALEYDQIVIKDCPFCREYSHKDDWSCEFVNGYIEGVIRSNPKTQNAKVTYERKLNAKSDDCIFIFSE